MNRSVSATAEGIRKLRAAKVRFKEDEDNKLTYEKLAENLKIASRTISRFFNGKAVDRENAYAILEYLELKPEEVLQDEDLLVEQSIRKIESSRSGTPDRAQKLISQLSEALDELKAGEENRLPAMEWLKSHRMLLSKGAAEAVLKKSNSNAEESDIESFSIEIRKYLKLIYFCLELGTWDMIDAAIQQSRVPNTRNALLYTEALSYVKDEADSQILSSDSKQVLNLCIDYLIQILPIRL